MYIDSEHKEFAENNQWIESALNNMSYLILVAGAICTIVFSIRNCDRPYLGFDWDYFDFCGFIVGLICTIVSFLSWKSLVIIVRCCLKYLNS